MKFKKTLRNLTLATTLATIPLACNDCAYSGKKANAAEINPAQASKMQETPSYERLEVVLNK